MKMDKRRNERQKGSIILKKMFIPSYASLINSVCLFQKDILSYTNYHTIPFIPLILSRIIQLESELQKQTSSM